MEHQPDSIVLFFGNWASNGRTPREIVQDLGEEELGDMPLEDVRDSALLIIRELMDGASYETWEDTPDGGITNWTWLGKTIVVDPNKGTVRIK